MHKISKNRSSGIITLRRFLTALLGLSGFWFLADVSIVAAQQDKGIRCLAEFCSDRDMMVSKQRLFKTYGSGYVEKG